MQQGREDPDRRRLARSIWAEEAEDRALGDLEVDAVEGAHGAEGLDQSLGRYGWL
jgi:hypothetical protein